MIRHALLQRLKQVQQTPRYSGRDITTISAVLSNDALMKHLVLCEEAAQAFSRTSGGESGRAGAGGI